MGYDVKVKIDLLKPIGKVGFGMPLILIENASAAIPYKEVTDAAEAVTAGLAANSDASKAVQLLFAQTHAPKRIAVCGVTTDAKTALADATLTDRDFLVIVPAFTVSELSVAFEIGFLLFLPFLVLDMVVASLLMSLGMMMLPPNVVSLPFKLIFFVLVDGWGLPETPGQAIAVAVAMPVNFIGNKLWSFRR